MMGRRSLHNHAELDLERGEFGTGADLPHQLLSGRRGPAVERDAEFFTPRPANVDRGRASVTQRADEIDCRVDARHFGLATNDVLAWAFRAGPVRLTVVRSRRHLGLGPAIGGSPLAGRVRSIRG